jgi:hypothetical protein
VAPQLLPMTLPGFVPFLCTTLLAFAILAGTFFDGSNRSSMACEVGTTSAVSAAAAMIDVHSFFIVNLLICLLRLVRIGDHNFRPTEGDA